MQPPQYPPLLINSSSRLPTSALQPYISHYAGCGIDGATPGVTRGLPSRHVSLMIGLDEPFEIQKTSSTRSFIGGLNDKPAMVTRRESIDCLHLFLNPLGIRTLFGFPAAELCDGIVDLKNVFGAFTEEFIGHLQELKYWPTRFDYLDQVFLSLFKPSIVTRELQWSWNALLGSEGKVKIAALAHEIGWSRRHFSEKFKQEFGISPKNIARVLRFEKACALLKIRQSLADVAATTGYYDQAHLSHEWQSLAGCSPKTWILEELPFLQDYELAALNN